MSWSEIKKAVNSDLNVPLNEINPIGFLDITKGTVSGRMLVSNAVAEVYKDYSIDLFSIQNEKGGKLYELSGIRFRQAYVGLSKFDVILEIDGEKIVLANYSPKNIADNLYYSSEIKVLDVKNNAFGIYYNSGIAYMLKSYLTNSRYEDGVPNPSKIPIKRNFDSSNAGVDFAYINGYIKFDKSIRLYVDFTVSSIDTHYATSSFGVEQISTIYYAYSLNE